MNTVVRPATVPAAPASQAGRTVPNPDTSSGTNDARQSSRFSTTAGQGETLAVSTSTARAAFVGEVGVTGVYDITERISLRAGYAIFWLGGLALAPEQYGVNQLCQEDPIRGATDTAGSVVVQGLSLGLEGRW